MAVDHDRRSTIAGSTIAGLHSVEARLHMPCSGEVMRVTRGGGAIPVARRKAGWWQRRVGATLWWRIVWRFVGPLWWVMRCRLMRGVGICMGTVAVLLVLVAGGLWLLLANGPISLDLVTPWLAGAVAENFGNRFKIDIGDTVLERDEHGRTAMRIRSITVRDHDGTVIASAPKAEVGFSGASLLSGRPRAQRLNLVGAELAIRVEADGQVTVSAGADEHPLAVAPASAVGGFRSVEVMPAATGGGAADAGPSLQETHAAFLTWSTVSARTASTVAN
jgi:hypothetical protein